jgi:Protein of unknown function (DUF664)
MRTRTLTCDTVADADVTAASATFKAECLAFDHAFATMSLDDTVVGTNNPISWRWVYVHMIEEYARVNGPADLLREAIVGATGA